MRTIVFCKHCVTPSSRPRVVFDENGVCNACRYAESKHTKIDWESRRREFLELIEPYRSRRGEWDCVVPWSGGKDSSYIAWRLKFEFGMNPLLVTFSPLIINEVGQRNREALLKLGFDQIFIRPNQDVARKLARRFFIERGNQKVAWDAGVTAAPVQVAAKFGISLVFYAEHGETEYGGKVRNEQAAKVRDFTEVIEHLVGDDPRNWVGDGVKLSDLNPYLYPERKLVEAINLKALYFGYFFPWSMYENYKFISSKYDFELAEGGRTQGTFTNFDSLDDRTDCLYYYMQFIKFGFGRAARDASRLIQNRQLTREQGLEYVRLYDHEFPSRDHQQNLDYLGLSEEEFQAIVDRHRNPEVWEKKNGEWKLNFEVA
jgi:N-acetyl sugar amidotransferase